MDSEVKPHYLYHASLKVSLDYLVKCYKTGRLVFEYSFDSNLMKRYRDNPRDLTYIKCRHSCYEPNVIRVWVKRLEEDKMILRDEPEIELLLMGFSDGGEVPNQLKEVQFSLYFDWGERPMIYNPYTDEFVYIADTDKVKL